MRGNPLFSSLAASFSCLVTIVETCNVEEVWKLIEMVNEISVAKKYLLLIVHVPTFDSSAVQNITTNFQIIVHHGVTGEVFLLISISSQKYFLLRQRGLERHPYALYWARSMHRCSVECAHGTQ